MPFLFHQPLGRRNFLRISAVGAAAIALSGCRAARHHTLKDQELHLALLSDTHIPADRTNGHRGFSPWDNLQRTAREVVAVLPQAVILNGDAARLEGKPGDYAELNQQLAPIAAAAPVLIGLGNHDDRANFLKAFPATKPLAQTVAGKHVLVYEHPVARILVLDSLQYVNQTAGLLGRTQRQWLAEYLPKHRDRPVVLFIHHTLKDGDGDLLDVDRLFAILRPQRHVKAIFYGHSHVWEIGKQDHIQLINLPAVGYNFRDQDPVGWVESRFHPQGVDLKLHAIGGNVTDNGRTSTVRWA